MTIAELRIHAWNFNALAQSADLNAALAATEEDVDLWNTAVIHLQDCADAFERRAAALEAQWVLPIELREIRA
jgi:hypothetical protein